MPADYDPQDTVLRIREMTIDDFPAVFHIGEDLFTSDYSPSMYRTWDEYEITTLYNSDNELCLVAEYRREILGHCSPEFRCFCFLHHRC